MVTALADLALRSGGADTAAKTKTAALKAVPGGTVYRVETDPAPASAPGQSG